MSGVASSSDGPVDHHHLVHPAAFGPEAPRPASEAQLVIRDTRCRGARAGRESVTGAASGSRRSRDRPARAPRGSRREGPGRRARPRRARAPSRGGLPRAPGCATRRIPPSRSTPRGRRRGARPGRSRPSSRCPPRRSRPRSATDSSASGSRSCSFFTRRTTESGARTRATIIKCRLDRAASAGQLFSAA